MLAISIIKKCIERLGADERLVQVFIDNAHMFGYEEIGFVKTKYQMQGLIQQQENAETIRIAPLVPLLSIFESNRSFIISFTPDNPVRQIMADIVAPAQGVVESETVSLKDKEKSPKQFPQVVPCAGRSIFNKASSDIYAGDPTSLRVAKWFEMYEVVEAGFNDDQKKVYGDISLHKYEISAVRYAPSSTAEPPAAGGDTTMGGTSPPPEQASAASGPTRTRPIPEGCYKPMVPKKRSNPTAGN